MKKLFSVLFLSKVRARACQSLCVRMAMLLLLLTLSVGNVWGEIANLNYSNQTNMYVGLSGSNCSWSSTSGYNTSSSSGAQVTFTPQAGTTITGIVFTFESSSADRVGGDPTVSTGSYSRSNTKGTWSGLSATEAITWKATNKFRMTNIEVTFTLPTYEILENNTNTEQTLTINLFESGAYTVAGTSATSLGEQAFTTTKAFCSTPTLISLLGSCCKFDKASSATMAQIGNSSSDKLGSLYKIAGDNNVNETTGGWRGFVLNNVVRNVKSIRIQSTSGNAADDLYLTACIADKDQIPSAISNRTYTRLNHNAAKETDFTVTSAETTAIKNKDLSIGFAWYRNGSSVKPTAVTLTIVFEPSDTPPTPPSTKYHVFVCPNSLWGDNNPSSVSINYQRSDDTWSGVQSMTLTGMSNGGLKVYGYETEDNPATFKTLQFVKNGDSYYGAGSTGQNDKLFNGHSEGNPVWINLPAPNNASAVYLVGSFNGWKNADDNYKLTKVDGNHYTGSFILDGANSNYEFKVNAVDALTGLGYLFSANGYWFSENTTATQLWSNDNNDQIVPLSTTGRFAIDVEYYGQYDNHGQLTITRSAIPVATFAKGNESATGSAPANIEQLKNTTFTLPANPFTLTGYDFTGWNDGENTYDAGAEYTMPAGGVNFAAQWTCATPAQPSVTGQQTYSAGENIQLTAADGYSSYQWYKGGTEDGNIIAGKTDNVLTINSCSLSDAGTYYCKVTNSCGNSAFSDGKAVTVNAIAPTITFSDGEYIVGGAALDLSTLFSSNSEGAVTYTVTDAGETGATIDGTSFTATAAGSATVQASQAANGNYSAKTATATITVSAAPAPGPGGEETFKTTGPGSDDKEVKDIDNVLTAGTIPGTYIAGINSTTGLKLRTGRSTANTSNGLQINVHSGFIVTKVVIANSYVNSTSSNRAITNVYVDGVRLNNWTSKNIGENSSNKTTITLDNISATSKIEFEFDFAVQYRADISITYTTPSSATWQIAGPITGKTGDDTWNPVDLTDNSYFEATLDKAQTYDFKIVKKVGGESTWYTMGSTPRSITSSACTDVAFSTAGGTENNTTLTSTVAGTYRFNVNTSGEYPVVSVVYPTACTVTYGENLSVDPSVTSGEQLAAGTELVFTAAERAGYNFAGFYSDESKTQEITGAGVDVEHRTYTVTLSGNTSVYAKYTPIAYTISYELNGGTNYVGAPATYTIETATIVLGTPTKTGYHFEGWYSEAGFENVETQIALGSTGNKTLYAKWHQNVWHVALSKASENTYEADGTVVLKINGEAQAATVDIPSGTTFSLSATPAVDCDEFSRWTWTVGELTTGVYTDAEVTMTVPADLAADADQAIIGYFKNKEYQISYNKNTEDEVTNMPETATVRCGNNWVPATDPIRDGYYFHGWKRASSETLYKNGDEGFAVTESETLTAQWALEVQNIEIHAENDINTIEVGEELQLSVTYDPDEATYGHSVEWNVDDARFLRVENGLVTALAAGNGHYVTATTPNGKSANYYITINASTCDKWQVHMWNNEAHTNTRVCLYQEGSTNEWRSRQVILPSNSNAEKLKVLYNGAPQTYSAEWTVRHTPMADNNGNAQFYAGQDAIGYFRIYSDNTTANGNYALAFEPIYRVTYGHDGQQDWVAYDFAPTATANRYETETIKLPASDVDNGSLKYYVGTKKSNGGTNFVTRNDDVNWDKSNTTDLKNVRNLGTGKQGRYGKFYIFNNYGDQNWYCSFDYYQYAYELRLDDETIFSYGASKTTETVSITSETPSKTGYTFRGWDRTKGKSEWSGDDHIAAGSNYTFWKELDIFYPVWQANTYNIIYKESDGSDFSGTHAQGYPTTHTYGVATPLLGATKDGYTFDGWYAEPELTNLVTTLAADAYTADITLYAKWTESVECDTYLMKMDEVSQLGSGSPYKYAKAGVGLVMRNGTGSSALSFSSGNCAESTKYFTTGNSEFALQTYNDITGLTIKGSGTGNNRTLTGVKASASMSNYQTIEASTGDAFDVSGQCDEMHITFTNPLVANTYLEIKLSGNINVYAIEFEDCSSKLRSDLAIADGHATIAMPWATKKNHTLTKDVDYTTSSTGAISCMSSDPAVATVTDAGVITAVGNGTTTITLSQASDEDYRSGSIQFTVTVSGVPAPVPFVIVSNVSELRAAVSAATSGGNIFLKNGTYDLGTTPLQIRGANVSLIGESREGVLIKTTEMHDNGNISSSTSAVHSNGKDNFYIQDLTVENYDSNVGTSNNLRTVALYDDGGHTILKNVDLHSYQDTYNSKGSNAYIEGGTISGSADYVCQEGTGKAYLQGVTMYNNLSKEVVCMSAPKGTLVFNECAVDPGLADSYTFGRNWASTGKDVWINTTLLDNGSRLATTRWTLKGIGSSSIFANGSVGEYQTKNVSGESITPASNNVTFVTQDESSSRTINTILSESQANNYTYSTIFGSWDPKTIATQKQMGALSLEDNTLSWSPVDGAIAYLVEKNGNFVDIVTIPSYTIEGETSGYSVRAANGRGGFGTPMYYFELDDVVITKQPDAINFSLDKNQLFRMNIEAVGSGAISYQWYKSATQEGEGESIAGATAATCIHSESERGTYYYYCVATCGTAQATSSRVAVLVVQSVTLTYAAGRGTGADIVRQVHAGDVITLAENQFTAPTNEMFWYWLGGAEMSAYFENEEYIIPDDVENITFTAQWILGEEALLKWEPNVNTSESTIGTHAKSSTATDRVPVASMSNITNSRLTISESQKSGLTSKIEAPATKDADKYMSVSFVVTNGSRCVPDHVDVQVQPVNSSKSATVELVLTDGIHTINYVESDVPSGSITTVTLPNENQVDFVNTVTLKIYVYGSCGTYRLGSPIQLIGAALPSTITRDGLTVDKLGTICYPYAFTRVDGATLYTISHKVVDGGSVREIVFDKVEDFPTVAGRPYLIRPSDDAMTMYCTGAPVKEAEAQETEIMSADDPANVNHGLFGSFDKFDFYLHFGEYDSDKMHYYIISNNMLRRSTWSGVGKSGVNANRAYVNMDLVPDEQQISSSPMRPYVLNVEGWSPIPTDLSELQGAERTQKVLIRGNIYILRGSKVFDLNGRLIY